jgi:predicted membrane protein
MDLKNDRRDYWRIVCYVAGALAAGGTVLQLLGWSPGRVSGRESGVDLIINHLMIFGPCLLACWVAFAASRNRWVIFWVPVLGTLIFFLGLMH